MKPISDGNGAAARFDFRAGYDAADNTSKARRQRTTNLLPEDEILRIQERHKIVSDTRDLKRNFAPAAWMFDKHLDFTSTFTFQSRTKDTGLDEEIENLVEEWSKAENCDIAGRHPLRRQIRLAECTRAVTGDLIMVKFDDGKLQAIEGDRIKNPTDRSGAQKYKGWKNGLKMDKHGRVQKYAVCKGTAYSSELDQIVPAAFAFHHFYMWRFAQCRGISPATTAINPFSDTYEGLDLTRARLKLNQLFGVKITRNGGGELGALTSEGSGTATDPKTYSTDFGQGPILWDMEPGDNLEFLETHPPTSELQTFTESELRLAFSCFGIPYSFYDVRSTTYSGARQDLLMYELRSDIVRQDNQDLLTAIINWRIALWILDGTIKLPRAFDLRNLRHEWVPQALPWIDPLKEIKADSLAIRAGLKSRQGIIKKRTGGEFADVLNELASEKTDLENKGLPTDPEATVTITEAMAQ